MVMPEEDTKQDGMRSAAGETNDKEANTVASLEGDAVPSTESSDALTKGSVQPGHTRGVD